MPLQKEKPNNETKFLNNSINLLQKQIDELNIKIIEAETDRNHFLA